MEMMSKYILTHRDKKYIIIYPITGKKIHFGLSLYQDYTKHKDDKRRQRFHQRNHKWTTADPYTNHTADLDLKQDTINDGDLTIAKTDGLLTVLDSTAKLASLNTFSGLQTVNGDFKAGHVLVKIIAPTLNTHLTSKLYVDTALIGKQNTLTAGIGIDITNNVISSSSSSSFVGFRVETAQEADMRIGTGGNIPFNVKTGGIGFL
jgi:hypothetical protein